MCDVPSIAVFCSESIEYFLGISSKFFLKLLVIIIIIIIILLLLLLPLPTLVVLNIIPRPFRQSILVLPAVSLIATQLCFFLRYKDGSTRPPDLVHSRPFSLIICSIPCSLQRSGSDRRRGVRLIT